MVLGVEPDKLPKRFDLKGALIPDIDGNKVLDLSRRKVIVSENVASELGLYVGSKVLIHSPQRLAEMIKIDKGGSFGLKNSSEIYLPMEFTVSALYSFNKYDFDKQIIFMNLDDADELFGVPWGAANIIYGWVPDPFNMKKLVETLEAELENRDFITWKKLNQRILGVLEVEKDMMFFILITIVFVAAFCIANTLIVVVIQKTREIGLLKALGASSGMVLRVFLLHGVIVGFLGSILGTVLGFTILYYRNDGLRFMREITGRDLFPKEFYFFNELPAHMVPTDVIFVCLISIMLCTLGALIPAAWAASLDPAKALRYE
jgi:lipoprotein-releasing system permease protein